MNKLLIISGPTATGKTDLAVKLAQKYNGELVSGDSCQIYRGMDIGTGKDHPQNTPIHLIDIINPNQKITASEFREIGLKTIKDIQSRQKLPILVGCSGFYIDSIVNNKYDTFEVKPKKILRLVLAKFSVKTLQNIYKLLNKDAFLKLNNSDVNNHYRLTRKIELSLTKKRNALPNESFDIFHLSLTAPLSFIYQSIDSRVDSRMESGFINEIKKLLKKYKWSDPGFQIAAYQCLKPYILKPSPEILDDCLQKWRFAEHSDARRQICWFKSKTNAVFFDITNKNNFLKINKTIDKWYNKSWKPKE